MVQPVEDNSIECLFLARRKVDEVRNLLNSRSVVAVAVLTTAIAVIIIVVVVAVFVLVWLLGTNAFLLRMLVFVIFVAIMRHRAC
jgi:hypothetical protein